MFSKSQHLEPVSVIDGSFEVNRTTAMRLKRDYLESANNELKKTYLKLLGECSDLLDSLRNTSGMGTLSRTLFSGVNWEDVASKRRENAQVLAEELHKAGIQCIHREGTAPLWVPFLPRCNRDEFQKRLSARNLYCPYLWPLPQNARGCSSYIDSFVDNMLCLPCDQRYDASDMKEIAEILKDEISA